MIGITQMRSRAWQLERSEDWRWYGPEWSRMGYSEHIRAYHWHLNFGV